MSTATKRGTAVAVLVAAAIMAPTASARPVEQFLPSSVNSAESSGVRSNVPQTRTIEVPASGFDWGDAGLGAAGMLSLLGLATGAAVIGRRSRGRSHPAIS